MSLYSPNEMEQLLKTFPSVSASLRILDYCLQQLCGQVKAGVSGPGPKKARVRLGA